jgi:hypothetical protein
VLVVPVLGTRTVVMDLSVSGRRMHNPGSHEFAWERHVEWKETLVHQGDVRVVVGWFALRGRTVVVSCIVYDKEDSG